MRHEPAYLSVRWAIVQAARSEQGSRKYETGKNAHGFGTAQFEHTLREISS
jgi:hypothetical protein